MKSFRSLLAIGFIFNTTLSLCHFGHATESSCTLSLAEKKANIITQLNPTSLIETYTIPFASAESTSAKSLRLDWPVHQVNIHDLPETEFTDRLDINRVATDFKLTRFQATEVQAQLIHAFPRGRANDLAFLRAIENVKAGFTISGLNEAKIKASKFTVVMDADETLFDQSGKKGYVQGIHTATLLLDGIEPAHISINPGAFSLVDTIREMGGTAVLFSRNRNNLINGIFDNIMVDEKPLRSFFDGILTNAHMVMNPDTLFDKNESKPTQIQGSVRKDLSVIRQDKIMIIDDNPNYVAQKHLLRVVPEYKIDQALNYEPFFSWSKPSSGNSIEYALHHTEVTNLEDLLKSMRNEYAQIARELAIITSDLEHFDIRMSAFSLKGQKILKQLMTSKNLSLEEGVDYISLHPETMTDK